MKSITGKKLLNPGFYCQREIEMESPCEDQCENCKVYYAPLQVELRLEQLKKLKVGKQVVAKSERGTVIKMEPSVTIISKELTKELALQCRVEEDEEIKGKVLEINYETGDVKILTPDGFEKTINIFNFLITIIPLIKQLVLFIRDLWREFRKS